MSALQSGQSVDLLKRFVVLEHTEGEGLERPVGSGLGVDAGLHWDWMFEQGDRLRTWATPPLPSLERADFEEADRSSMPWDCGAIELPDHRRLYLDYEGPISRERGSVRRIASGRYETLWSEDEDTRYRLRLESVADMAFSVVLRLEFQRKRGAREAARLARRPESTGSLCGCGKSASAVEWMARFTLEESGS